MTNDAPDIVDTALRHAVDIAHRLPSGEPADRVRQSLAELVDAARRGTAVEGATRQLVGALHQLDESHVGGLRRDFQRSAPAVSRVLEALQEEVLPAMRRKGFKV